MSEKQEKYVDAKDTVLRYLKELSEILETVGEEPLSGDNRSEFMSKFNMLDRRLIDRLDVRSAELHEEVNE